MNNLDDIKNLLTTSYDASIANHVLDAFVEIEENFALEKWKPSELDAGHFVEAVRRIIEYELFGGVYTPFGQSLPNFNDQELRRYEQQTGDQSFRMLIPRSLKAVYNIRNKRGVGHVGPVSPNVMDATFILYSVKWVLAELVRLKSGLSANETQRLVNNVVERRIELLWKSDSVTRILNSKISAAEQVLILLFDRSPQTIDELRHSVEYSNASNFKNKILKQLHDNRLLERNVEDNVVMISPSGKAEAEKLILKYLND